MYSLRPGAVDRPRNLERMIAEDHERQQAARLAQIARREEQGVPLSDALSAPEACEAAGAVLADPGEAGGPEAAAREALGILSATIDGPLAPIPDREHDEDLAGITVTLRGMSRRRLLEAQGEIAKVRDAWLADAIPYHEAEAQTLEVMRRAVAEGVARVEGVQGPQGALVVEGHPLDDEALDILEGAELMGTLWRAVDIFHGLKGEAKKNCGCAPPST